MMARGPGAGSCASRSPNPVQHYLSALAPDSGLLRALRGLPDEFRNVVYLADIEGYPYREIAGIMDTPVETVISRLHRGRLRILEQLTAGSDLTPAPDPSQSPGA
jgi:DNA-directed RNA polymerase specialized sigma24 family protein